MTFYNILENELGKRSGIVCKDKVQDAATKDIRDSTLFSECFAHEIQPNFPKPCGSLTPSPGNFFFG